MIPTIAILFAGRDYSPLELTLLILGAGIAALLVSAVGRLAYFAHKTHLVLQEIQKELSKLVMLRRMESESPLQPPSPAPPNAAAGGAPPAPNSPGDRPQ